jgi:diacylglycerol kinase
MTSFYRFLASLRHAIRGLHLLFRTENSFRIHIISAVLAIILAIIADLRAWQWIGLLLAIAGVLFAEGVNSAFEKTLDVVEPRLRPQVGKIKDMLAGAVLLVSLCAFAIGVILFYPYIRSLFDLIV